MLQISEKEKPKNVEDKKEKLLKERQYPSARGKSVFSEVTPAFEPFGPLEPSFEELSQVSHRQTTGLADVKL